MRMCTKKRHGETLLEDHIVTIVKVVDPTSPPSCRFRAADSVLDHAANALEIEDIGCNQI